ncbi:MAG: hypothetical protein CR986_03530 [Ignavibacteriae bacterium]|nr:MAG: hypothetical protein CR986_03530 [Ignavibacteriota bacterium]
MKKIFLLILIIFQSQFITAPNKSLEDQQKEAIQKIVQATDFEKVKYLFFYFKFRFNIYRQFG